MANTATDLAKDILRGLSLLDSTAEPSAEDLRDVTASSRRIHAKLRKDNICYWSEDDIPDEVFDSLSTYLQSMIGKGYGLPFSKPDQDVRYEQLKTDATPNYSGAKMRSDFPFVGRRFGI